MEQFIRDYGFLIFLVAFSIFIAIVFLKWILDGVTPFDVNKFIEEKIVDDKFLNGEISYKTQVMMTLVDMNVHDSVVLDVERGQHDHTINYFQKNGMTPIQCAEFIQSSY